VQGKAGHPPEYFSTGYDAIQAQQRSFRQKTLDALFLPALKKGGRGSAPDMLPGILSTLTLGELP
jgi:hypothetical protein